MRQRGHLLIWELQLVLLFIALKSEGSGNSCPVGYTRDKNGDCTDEDECRQDADYEDLPGICDENAKCFNTKGSYYCQCEPGFKSNKGNVNFTAENPDKCKDFDECIEEMIDCGPHAVCKNSKGSYACVCDNGFRINSGKETFLNGEGQTCQDIDECIMENINCGPHATCENNEGSYHCVCEDGFETSSGKKTFLDRKGVTCQDKDECVLNATICGGNAKCHNTPGSYDCSCNPGFSENNKTGVCESTDECEADSNICGGNATCHSIPQGHYCVCNSGFRLRSGKTKFTNKAESCEDICDLQPLICGEGECRQGLNGHQCICHKGYTNYGFSQEACTAFNCDWPQDDVSFSQTLPELESCHLLLSRLCKKLTGNNTTGASAQDPGLDGPLDGQALLLKFLSPIEGLPSNKTLSGEHVTTMLSLTDRAVKVLGPLLNRGLSTRNNTAGVSAQDGMELLMKLLSIMDDLLSKGLINSKQVPKVLALNERALKTFEPLLNQGLQSGKNMSRASDRAEALDGKAFLERLLSIIDGLLSKGPLGDGKQVTTLLSSVEGALKLIGPLLKDRQTNASSRYVEVKLMVERATAPPTGPVCLLSGSAQLDTHWETATGATFPGFATIAFLSYKNLEDSTNASFATAPNEAKPKFQMNSKVVTATVSNLNTTQLTKNVTLSFRHLSAKEEEHKCVYWNHRREAWSDHGCTAELTNLTHTVCSCNHLSSFAVLMALYEVEDTFELVLMTWVGLSLSIVCLLACVLTFAFCRSIQSTRNTIHLHLSFSLLIASIIFLAGISRTENQTGCAVVAGLLHFFYLAVFCWMLLEGVQLFRMVVLVFHTTLRSLYLMAVGYGIPAVIVAISVAVYSKGYGSKRLCWFDVKENAFIWSFLGPVCVIIAANAFFFLVTVYKLAEKFSSLNPDLNNLRKIRTFTITAVAQLAVLGTMWIFGCFQFKSTMAMSYIFVFLNCLQGVLMFVMHCLLNKQVREEYGKFLACICAPHKPKYSDFSSNQSKSQLSKSAQNTGESQI